MKSVYVNQNHLVNLDTHQDYCISLLVAFLISQIQRERWHSEYQGCVYISKKLIQTLFRSKNNDQTLSKLHHSWFTYYFELVEVGQKNEYSSAYRPSESTIALSCIAGEWQHMKVVTKREFGQLVTETSVLDLLKQDLKVSAITEELGVSPSTIKRIKSKYFDELRNSKIQKVAHERAFDAKDINCTKCELMGHERAPININLTSGSAIALKLVDLDASSRWLDELKNRTDLVVPYDLNLDTNGLDDDLLVDWDRFISYHKLCKSTNTYQARFSVKDSGRSYELNKGIQSLPSGLRSHLLPFQYSYDLDSASIRYYVHLLESNGYQCNALFTYVTWKTTIRQWLAIRLDLPLKDIKRIIAGITFGMLFINRTKTGDYQFTASQKPRIKKLLFLIDPNDSLAANRKYKRMIDNPFIYNFCLEIMRAHEIASEQGYCYRDGQTSPLAAKTKKKRAAQSYQGFESHVMALLVDGLDPHEYFLVHDQVYCDIPPAEMNQRLEQINTLLGVEMSFDSVDGDVSEVERLKLFELLDQSYEEIAEVQREREKRKREHSQLLADLNELRTLSESHEYVINNVIDLVRGDSYWKQHIGKLIREHDQRKYSVTELRTRWTEIEQEIDC